LYEFIAGSSLPRFENQDVRSWTGLRPNSNRFPQFRRRILNFDHRRARKIAAWVYTLPVAALLSGSLFWPFRQFTR
jgi:hypothetical protein